MLSRKFAICRSYILAVQLADEVPRMQMPDAQRIARQGHPCGSMLISVCYHGEE